MARPQADDYDKKRSLIANKAAELFAQKGAASASLSQVAAASQMSKSLIYHYYSSKEELLYDVMSQHMNELIAIIDDLEKMQLQGADAFKTFTRILMDHYVGAANNQKVLLYELENISTEDRKTIVTLQRKLIAYAESLLREALGDIMISHTELRARTMLFFGMLNWSHSWFNPDGEMTRYELADMASDTTLKAIKSGVV